ncbi:hypothetical protein [Albirhodobacter sp. R86504]|uniref:hypothetical protein n=1 Tax=Albirhodobacter sp. R86504 TaxID=3093848 RepID=UPI0036702570
MKHTVFDGQGGFAGQARSVKPLIARHSRAGLREISVQHLLEWAFGVEHVELSHPDELAPVPVGMGMEWRLIEQAKLGCRVDGGGRSHAHEDAETVANVVASIAKWSGDWTMALRIADLARSGQVPDWCKDERPRCIPRSWTQNQYGDHAATAVAETITQVSRGKEVKFEVKYCPVTYSPSAAHISAKRRDYLAWYGALLEIASLLRGAGLVAYTLNDVMPPMTPWR